MSPIPSGTGRSGARVLSGSSVTFNPSPSRSPSSVRSSDSNGLWTSVAGIAGILFGAMFMAAHAAQGPTLGLPQMIQSRAQFGYTGVIVPLVATTLTFVGFNVVTAIIIKQGLFDIFRTGTRLR